MDKRRGCGEQTVVDTMEGINNLGFEVGGGWSNLQIGFECEIKLGSLHVSQNYINIIISHYIHLNNKLHTVIAGTVVAIYFFYLI